MPLTASDLYAISCGYRNDGIWLCHWCGAKCSDRNEHDDAPRLIGVRRAVFARYPCNPWICNGCWLWRRQRITVTYLDGKWKDRQCPMDHSWYVTPTDAKAIRPECHDQLARVLLNPPRCFSLSLVEPGEKNHLQLCQANDEVEVKGGTPLVFTLNGIPHSYTVYELDNALQDDNAHAGPGVLALIRHLGLVRKERKLVEGKERGVRGRKKDEMPTGEPLRKVIQASGAVVAAR